MFVGCLDKHREEKQEGKKQQSLLISIQKHLQLRIEMKVQHKAKLQHSSDFAAVGLLPTHSIQQFAKQSSSAMLFDFK